MRSFNAKTGRACAFCKYWYDPTNAAIKPKDPVIGTWYYDEKAKNRCMKMHNTEKSSWAMCRDYECKV